MSIRQEIRDLSSNIEEINTSLASAGFPQSGNVVEQSNPYVVALAYVTAVDGSSPGKYTWSEYTWDDAGNKIPLVGGRSGNPSLSPAFEINGFACIPPFYCRLRLSTTINSVPIWDFDSLVEAATAKIIVEIQGGATSFSGISTLDVETTDGTGLNLTNPSAPVAKLLFQDASATNSGIVNQTSQSWTGNKLFRTSASFYMGSGSNFDFRGGQSGGDAGFFFLELAGGSTGSGLANSGNCFVVNQTQSHGTAGYHFYAGDAEFLENVGGLSQNRTVIRAPSGLPPVTTIAGNVGGIFTGTDLSSATCGIQLALSGGYDGSGFSNPCIYLGTVESDGVTTDTHVLIDGRYFQLGISSSHTGPTAFAINTGTGFHVGQTGTSGGGDTVTGGIITTLGSGSTITVGTTPIGGSTNGGVLSVSGGNLSEVTGTNGQVGIWNGTTFTATTVSGDINFTGAGVSTIQNNVVTNAKLAQVPGYSFKGSNASGTGNVTDLTAAQAWSILDSVNPMSMAYGGAL